MENIDRKSPKTGEVARSLILQGVAPKLVMAATRVAVPGSGITMNSVYTYRSDVRREIQRDTTA